jgi:hypothetical protein
MTNSPRTAVADATNDDCPLLPYLLTATLLSPHTTGCDHEGPYQAHKKATAWSHFETRGTYRPAEKSPHITHKKNQKNSSTIVSWGRLGNPRCARY